MSSFTEKSFPRPFKASVGNVFVGFVVGWGVTVAVGFGVSVGITILTCGDIAWVGIGWHLLF